MHLWPSLRLRDSFNNAYLKKLEWNLHRMNTEKQRQQNESQNDCSSSNQQKLLDDANYSENSNKCGGLVFLCREILMILSCFYCCFCCGGLVL